jgi:hypothetical protein
VVADIQKTTLADIIARNSGLKNLQADVFTFHASIGGTVFADGNRDGLRQTVEKGIASATVSLLDAAGAVIATTTSDSSGRYLFTGLDLGSYRVAVSGTGGPSGSTSTTGRIVAITKGNDIRGVDVAVPSGMAQPPKAPAPKPAAAPLPTTTFAALGSLPPLSSQPLSGKRRA